jgi:hypothetical protein
VKVTPTDPATFVIISAVLLAGGNLRVLDTGASGDESGSAGGAALRVWGRDIWKSIDELPVLRVIS